MPGPPAEQHRRVRVLASGMVAAQVAAIVATPVLTRLYGPSAFGAYALQLSLLAAFAPVAALRFDAAMILPEAPAEARQLMRTGVIAAFGFSLFVSVVLWVAWPLLLAGDLLDGSAIGLLPWLPPLLLAAGLFQLGMAWQIREGFESTAASGRALQGILTAGGQIALGVVWPFSAALVAGDLLGRVGSIFALFPWTRMRRGIPATGGAKYAGRYRGFATYSSLAALLNAFGSALPVLFVGATLGVRASGLLLLSQRIASLPTSVVGTAISQVFAVDLARAPADARVAIYCSTLRRIVRYALPIFASIAIFSQFFGSLFGEDWHGAGLVCAILVPFYLMQLLSGATIVAVDVLQAHKARLMRETIFVSGMLLVLLGTARAGVSLPWIAAAITSFGMLFYAVSLRWVAIRMQSRS